MKQTAVEFLLEIFERYKSQNSLFFAEDFAQAKEIEKQQQDDYAIEFLEWFDKNCYARGKNSFLLWDNDDEPLTPKELLIKFKQQEQ
jgi:hypothetical protein